MKSARTTLQWAALGMALLALDGATLLGAHRAWTWLSNGDGEAVLRAGNLAAERAYRIVGARLASAGGDLAIRAVRQATGVYTLLDSMTPKDKVTIAYPASCTVSPRPAPSAAPKVIDGAEPPAAPGGLVRMAAPASFSASRSSDLEGCPGSVQQHEAAGAVMGTRVELREVHAGRYTTTVILEPAPAKLVNALAEDAVGECRDATSGDVDDVQTHPSRRVETKRHACRNAARVRLHRQELNGT